MMAVRVDESGRQCLAAGIDHALALPRLELADFDDPLAIDAHGAFPRLASRAVDDRGIDDQGRRRTAALRTRDDTCEQRRTDCRAKSKAAVESLRGLLDLLEWQAAKAR